MWQDDFAFEAFIDRGPAFLKIGSQRHNVCDHPGDSPGVEAAHGQYTSKDGIFVSTWKVSATYHQT